MLLAFAVVLNRTAWVLWKYDTKQEAEGLTNLIPHEREMERKRENEREQWKENLKEEEVKDTVLLVVWVEWMANKTRKNRKSQLPCISSLQSEVSKTVNKNKEVHESWHIYVF